MKRRVIGLDAGGTKLLAGVVDEGGEVLFRTVRNWPEGATRDDVLRCIREATNAAIAAVGAVDAIGLGLPATMDLSIGVAAGCRHLPITGFNFRDWLAAEFEPPAFVDNDATLALLAEQRMGVARGASEVVLLTLGTGIGGGLMSGGRLVRGARGAAGEPGHMSIDADGPPCPGDCPGRGCLEAYVSGPALGRAVGLRPEEVTAAARGGDERAIAAFTAMGEKLGVGVASLLNLLDPELIVIGGGLGSDAGWLLIEPAERVARQRALEPAASSARIVPAALGEEAGMRGAALLALDGGAA